MKKKELNIILFFFISLIYTRFLDFRPLNILTNNLLKLVFPLLAVTLLPVIISSRTTFSSFFKVIIISLFIPILICFSYWDQTIISSLKALAPYSFFLVYFFVYKSELRSQTVLNFLISASIITAILYLFQITIFKSIVLFGGWNEFKETRGILRILFPGEGFLFFGYFYFLIENSKKFNLKNLTLLALLIFVIIMQASRVYLFTIALITTYHFLLNAKLLYKIILPIIIMLIFYFFDISDNVLFQGIKEVTQRDIEAKEEYVRFVGFNYFINEFPKNNVIKLFGNGAYYYNSDYGRKIIELAEYRHLYLEDLGIVKGYTLFGLTYLFAYFGLILKGLRIKVSNNERYLKYFIFAILILSFTTRASFNANFGIAFILSLFLIEQKKLR